MDCVLTTENAIEIALDKNCVGNRTWEFTDIIAMYNELRFNMEQCHTFESRDTPLMMPTGGRQVSTIDVPAVIDPRVTRVLIGASVRSDDPTKVTMTLSKPSAPGTSVVLHRGEQRNLDAVIFDDFASSPQPDLNSGWVGWWLKENFPGWLATLGISAEGNEFDVGQTVRPTEALLSLSQEETTTELPPSGTWTLEVVDNSGSSAELRGWSLTLCGPPMSQTIVAKEIEALERGCFIPERAACPAIAVDGQSCQSPGGQHYCGFVAAGLGYDTMPPPPPVPGAALTVGPALSFVQPDGERSYYCSQAPSNGSIEQVAWLEPRVGDTRLKVSLQLFYKQAARDDTWELVMETDEELSDTNVIRGSARTPPGCWLWVVNAEQGYGQYDMYLFASSA